MVGDGGVVGHAIGGTMNVIFLCYRPRPQQREVLPYTDGGATSLGNLYLGWVHII